MDFDPMEPPNDAPVSQLDSAVQRVFNSEDLLPLIVEMVERRDIPNVAAVNHALHGWTVKRRWNKIHAGDIRDYFQEYRDLHRASDAPYPLGMQSAVRTLILDHEDHRLNPVGSGGIPNRQTLQRYRELYPNVRALELNHPLGNWHPSWRMESNDGGQTGHVWIRTRVDLVFKDKEDLQPTCSIDQPPDLEGFTIHLEPRVNFPGYPLELKGNRELKEKRERLMMWIRDPRGEDERVSRLRLTSLSLVQIEEICMYKPIFTDLDADHVEPFTVEDFARFAMIVGGNLKHLALRHNLDDTAEEFDEPQIGLADLPEMVDIVRTAMTKLESLTLFFTVISERGYDGEEDVGMPTMSFPQGSLKYARIIIRTPLQFVDDSRRGSVRYQIPIRALAHNLSTLGRRGCVYEIFTHGDDWPSASFAQPQTRLLNKLIRFHQRISPQQSAALRKCSLKQLDIEDYEMGRITQITFDENDQPVPLLTARCRLVAQKLDRKRCLVLFGIRCLRFGQTLILTNHLFFAKMQRRQFHEMAANLREIRREMEEPLFLLASRGASLWTEQELQELHEQYAIGDEEALRSMSTIPEEAGEMIHGVPPSGTLFYGTVV